MVVNNTTAVNSSSSLSVSNTTTTSSSPNSPFCLDCGFNFGHIIDGVNDKLAGILLVTLVLLMIGVVCFLAGCYLYSEKTYKKVNQKEAAADESADQDE